MGLLRPHIERLAAYVPGEQPQAPGWIKLNTNENPYLAPTVVEALRREAAAPHNLYPDPTCQELRQRLGKLYDWPADQIIVGNGSDELLRLILTACVGEGERVVFPYPSYALYLTLAEIHHALPVEIELDEDFQLPLAAFVAANGKATFVAQPNAPTGTLHAAGTLRALCAGVQGVVVADEAYVDFAGEGGSALELLADHPNLVVVRTMSKEFGLAGMRVGYAFAARSLIAGLYKVKDSYNVNRLSQIAALAALDARAEYARQNHALARRRDDLAALLRQRFAFRVWPSSANFLFVDTRPHAARTLFEQLRDRRILVRYWDQRRLGHYLRITIGTEEEMAVLVTALDTLLGWAAGAQPATG